MCTGHKTVLWNVDPKDYACTSAVDLRRWFGNNPVHEGDVILLHDVFPWAEEIIPELIEEGLQSGVHFERLNFERRVA
jgi:peptidoglycan/xylan/chitin deacetylase (PgdA/CDA1 family)